MRKVKVEKSKNTKKGENKKSRKGKRMMPVQAS
jgi:hypothetical protein